MRRGFKIAPILMAIIAFGIYYFSSESFVNPVTGRKSHIAMSQEQELALGVKAFSEVLEKSEVVASGIEHDLVNSVSSRLIKAVGKEGDGFKWSVALVKNDTVNAFCLPGGKIVVYTGIIPVTQNESGLATVIGHEIAHATSRHGAERLFQEGALNIALKGVAGATSEMSPQEQRVIMGAIGAGSKFGVLLPYSRKHEFEADQIGLHYMRKAGFDGNEAVRFWERMSKLSASANKPPEFASTHPADASRIAALKELLAKSNKP